MSLFLFLHTSRSFLKQDKKNSNAKQWVSEEGIAIKGSTRKSSKYKYERGMKNFTDLISVITTRRESSTLQSQKIYIFHEILILGV